VRHPEAFPALLCVSLCALASLQKRQTPAFHSSNRSALLPMTVCICSSALHSKRPTATYKAASSGRRALLRAAWHTV
jgi:hypothetical protein